MAIDLTWRSIGAFVAIAGGILIAFFAGTGGMMEWRIEALQSQLDDRMDLYKHEIELVEKRLDRLEDRERK